MKVIVVGGGPDGMMAAIAAALNGNEVTIIEKNEKLGKKLFITGKGRCNVTNAGDMDDIRAHILSNPKFMYSAFYEYNNFDVIDFFESEGVKTKVERGNRVFPESDKSSDIIKALTKKIRELGIEVLLNTKVVDIKTRKVTDEEITDKKSDYESAFAEVSLSDKSTLKGDALIIATGGLSYPVTGSDGDGYKWAEKFGIDIVKPRPALVPVVLKEEDVRAMQGLSLKNVSAKFTISGKEISSESGEMLFTHFGVSGPIILSASSLISGRINDNTKLYIDLKPALDFETLDKRILKDFEKYSNKNFNNSLDDLLPKKMIPVIVKRSGIDPYKKVNVITAEERQKLVSVIKNLEFTVVGLRSFDEAIITKGGINVKEVNPKTFESKKVKGLYFIGEVLDVDATTGGYNLQIAWSSGYACGINLKDW